MSVSLRGGLGMAISASAVLIAAGACKKQTAQVVYQAVPVERRDNRGNAQPAGAIHADTTVQVNSKA
jgi:hypothetical protein